MPDWGEVLRMLALMGGLAVIITGLALLVVWLDDRRRRHRNRGRG